MMWKMAKLGSLITQRKAFIIIDDNKEYKRCRVQVNRKGVVLRDMVKGSAITTKKQQICKEGDFLVAEIDAKVGGYGFIGNELEGAIVSSHYFLFDVDETKMLKSYLAWLIKTEIIQDQITSKGSTNYAAIRPKNVLELEIPLPVLIADQKEIVDRLTYFHNGYSQLQLLLDRQKAYVQVLRRTILQEAVQGRLISNDVDDNTADELVKCIKAEKHDLVKKSKLKKDGELPMITDDEIPFGLPKNWTWCRFGDIANICSNLVDPLKNPDLPQIAPDIIEKGTGRLLNMRSVKEAGVKSWNHHFFPGQIIYSKIRPNLSKATIVDFEGLCSADMYPIQASIDSQYLLLYILSIPFLDQVIKNDNRVKMPKINQLELRNVLVPVPPIKTQAQIVLKVKSLNHHIDSLESQIISSQSETLQLLRVLLREVFGGKANAFVTSREGPAAMDDKRKVLAGHIIHHLHQEKYFGLTKFQKTLFVAEHHAQVEWQMEYEQEVAGPYDRTFTKSFRKEMKQQDWFQEHTKVSMTHFMPGANVNQLIDDYQISLADKIDRIEFVLKLFKAKTLLESELIATLYAVWNNRILQKKNVDLERLVEDIYAWSKRKSIYTKKHIATAYQWMLKVGLVPTGFGKEIINLKK